MCAVREGAGYFPGPSSRLSPTQSCGSAAASALLGLQRLVDRWMDRAISLFFWETGQRPPHSHDLTLPFSIAYPATSSRSLSKQSKERGKFHHTFRSSGNWQGTTSIKFQTWQLPTSIFLCACARHRPLLPTLLLQTWAFASAYTFTSKSSASAGGRPAGGQTFELHRFLALFINHKMFFLLNL